jgi:hypothetical protein
MMLQTFLLSALAVFFGLLLCFGGYRFFMVMLPVWSFFAGFWLGTNGFQLVFGNGFFATVTGITLGLVLGILLAIFSWQFYEIGLALLGGIVGGWFISGLMLALGFNPGWLMTLVTLAVALVTAVFTFLRDWQRYVVIMLSAIFGANALVLSLLLPLGRVSIAGLQNAGTAIRPILQDSWFWSLVWLGLALAGIFIQLRNYRQVVFHRDEFVKYWS